jgi:hypothetical protein
MTRIFERYLKVSTKQLFGNAQGTATTGRLMRGDQVGRRATSVPPLESNSKQWDLRPLKATGLTSS